MLRFGYLVCQVLQSNDEEMNGGGEGVSAPSAAAPLDWKFSQVFGERTAGEEVQEGTVFGFSILED